MISEGRQVARALEALLGVPVGRAANETDSDEDEGGEEEVVVGSSGRRPTGGPSRGSKRRRV
jgi:hypothetical protein